MAALGAALSFPAGAAGEERASPERAEIRRLASAPHVELVRAADESGGGVG